MQILFVLYHLVKRHTTTALLCYNPSSNLLISLSLILSPTFYRKPLKEQSPF
ncbi:hypothetical protein GBAR_LOCUS4209 [Geodia barretti]|uniref:Uncharacterized protein n=1 Tax=Geodia barretti TaxID=519541 RepID=A0AA35R5X4_GEOBA|nr:hypothetical protein GBAR_LOCUS4209 [Geodia barretti]